MARLTTARRHALPNSEVALPNATGSKGKGMYPVDTAARARNALSRVSQFGSPAQKKTVRAKVHSKFPGIGRKSGHRFA